MIRLVGESASRGMAMGPAYLLDVNFEFSAQAVRSADWQGELTRLDSAIATADTQLEQLALQLQGEHSGKGYDLIGVHRAMLASPDLAGEARRLIADEHITAESAVTRTLEHIRSVFAGIDEQYFRERGGDFDVVGRRLLRVLLGLAEPGPGNDAPSGGIAVAVSLSSVDLFPLSRAGIVGLVAAGGGSTSHAAIMARAFGLPYVVGVDGLLAEIRAGSTVIVDGTRGNIVIDPDAPTVHDFQMRMGVLLRRRKTLIASSSLPAVTLDGTHVHLAANVEVVAGVTAALSAGAESIGLFRTEFLYLDRADLPTEEEQFADAVAALRSANGIPVIFRALDLGGDKLPRVVKVPTGPNPALGIRSTRFLLERPEVLRCQLRALYRAASLGPSRLIFPLVTGVTELSRLRVICDEVLAELARKGAKHEPATPVGVMIETPSAAQTADYLAKRCDFLSIGTNDLIQFSFAADRGNDDVAYLYQPLHPSVLRTLKQLAEMAGAAKKPISICGDMAGDPFLTWMLLGLGFRNLSMDPDRIPLVRAVIRGSSLAEAQRLTAQALELESEIDTVELVRLAMADRFRDVLEGFVPARPS